MCLLLHPLNEVALELLSALHLHNNNEKCVSTKRLYVSHYNTIFQHTIHTQTLQAPKPTPTKRHNESKNPQKNTKATKKSYQRGGIRLRGLVEVHAVPAVIAHGQVIGLAGGGAEPNGGALPGIVAEVRVEHLYVERE